MADDVVRAIIELAGSQHHALSRRQASSLGFSSRRVATALRRGWLHEPVPGVLVVGPSSTWHRRLMVGVLAAGGHGAVSHRAAARLQRLDGFDHAGMAAVELSIDRAHRLRLPGCVTHHVTPWEANDLTTVDGIACTTLHRTVADLGSVVQGRKPLQRALTSARRRGLDLLHARETADRLHRPGQAGTGRLLRLLDAIPFEGRVPDSWFEELVAECVNDPGIPEVIAQCPIRDEHGTIVARADLGIPSVRLGLEAHSRRFHFGPIAEPLDEERDLLAARCGWELLYLGWYATKRPAEVLRVIKDVVRVRRRELTGAAA